MVKPEKIKKIMSNFELHKLEKKIDKRLKNCNLSFQLEWSEIELLKYIAGEYEANGWSISVSENLVIFKFS